MSMLIPKTFFFAEPDTAWVVTGKKDSPLVIRGRRIIRWPWFWPLWSMKMISYRQVSIDIDTDGVETQTIIAADEAGGTKKRMAPPIHMISRALIKVKSCDDSTSNTIFALIAMERFSGNNPYNAEDFLKNMKITVGRYLEGIQRSIAGAMDAEVIVTGKEAFAELVRGQAKSYCDSAGIEIVYTVVDIKDSGDSKYLADLISPTAQKAREVANIATLDANTAIEIKKQKTQMEIAEAELKTETRKAEVRRDIEKKRAEAAVLPETVKAELTKELREVQITIAEQEAKRDVNIPAEAEKFRIQTIGEGQAAALKYVLESQEAHRFVYLMGKAIENKTPQEVAAALGSFLGNVRTIVVPGQDSNKNILGALINAFPILSGIITGQDEEELAGFIRHLLKSIQDKPKENSEQPA